MDKSPQGLSPEEIAAAQANNAERMMLLKTTWPKAYDLMVDFQNKNISKEEMEQKLDLFRRSQTKPNPMPETAKVTIYFDSEYFHTIRISAFADDYVEVSTFGS